MRTLEEELKTRAVERFKELAKEDYENGYKAALQMISEGKIDLITAERLCTVEGYTLGELEGKSSAYIKGFIDAVRGVLETSKTSL